MDTLHFCPAARDAHSLCSGLSFQGCFCELPWKVEGDSISLLTTGRFVFFLPLFCMITMVFPLLEQRSDRFACKPIIKDFGFPKPGVSQLGCKTQCIMKRPAGPSFSWSPWYRGAGQELSRQTSCLLCCG